MPAQTKYSGSFSSTVIVLLVFQTVIVLCIYPVVIGLVVLSFKYEILQLEIAIDNLKSHSTTRPRAPELEPSGGTGQQCSCSNPVDNNNAINWNGDTDLLRCCATDEEALKMLIVRLIDEDRSQHNRETRPGRQTLTVGAIERLVMNIIRQNQTDNTGGSSSNIQPSIGGIIPIAAHLTGRPSHGGFTANMRIRHEANFIKVGPWEYFNGQSFTRRIEVDEHHMIVPKSGIYYIYSQVYFLDDRDKDSRQGTDFNEYLHFTMRDNKRNQPDPINLMKSGRTQHNSDYYYSSYHSGLFRLTEYDRIYMKVYLPSDDVRLDYQQESTFMGMFFLSGDD